MKNLVLQVSRFASVGLVATGVHALVYGVLGSFSNITPMAANLLAFVVAFGFSYLGHFRFTFSEQMQGRSALRSYPVQLRFLVVALLGLGLNALGVWVTTDYLKANYLLAILPMVFIVPLITFGVSKIWAFR